MKKMFSPKWISSKQPRKQRKYRYNAPVNIRHEMISAHLEKSLRKTYKLRSLPVRKGDEVTVLRGEFKKKTGKVTKIDSKKLKIYIDTVKRKKVTGQDVEIAIDPSNVMITKVELNDKKRQKFMKRKNIKHETVAEAKPKKEDKKK